MGTVPAPAFIFPQLGDAWWLPAEVSSALASSCNQQHLELTVCPMVSGTQCAQENSEFAVSTDVFPALSPDEKNMVST